MNNLPGWKVALKSFLIGAGISFLLLALSAWLGGLFYEEYDPMFASLTSNKLTPTLHQVVSLYVLGHIGTTYIYSYLYHQFPPVEWISLANGLFLIVGGGMAWLILSLFIRGGVVNTITKLAFLWLFYSSHLVLFNLTRGAFLLCGTSLLLLVIVYCLEADRNKRWKWQLICAFIFLLGLLTRPEPALIILFFGGAFSLLFLRGLIKPIQVLFIPGVITIMLFACIVIDRSHSTDFYKLVEPDLEYQVRVQQNCIPISAMKTAADSMRYEAALGGLWSDPNQVSVSFLRSIVNKQRDFHRMRDQWKEFYPIIGTVAGRHLPLVLLSALMAVIFLLFSLRFLSLRISILWVLIYLLFWALIFMQTYLSKINDRSFDSLLSLYLLVQITFYLAFLKELIKGAAVLVVPSGLVVFSCVQFFWTLDQVRIFREEKEQFLNQYAWVKQEVHGGTLVLNGSSYIPFMLSFTPFKEQDYSGFSRVYWFDLFYMSTVHPYKEFLAQECNCDVSDFSNFYRFLMKQDKEVYLLSTPRRVQLVTRYLHTIHNLDCTFEQVPETNRPVIDASKILQGPGNLKLFKLKKD
ncbi:MAG: hypothetical protein JWO06_2382 [Bacteroidota bacterium]|nr:hypothetical protein [Bacteroidota bacterium]